MIESASALALVTVVAAVARGAKPAVALAVTWRVSTAPGIDPYHVLD